MRRSTNELAAGAACTDPGVGRNSIIAPHQNRTAGVMAWSRRVKLMRSKPVLIATSLAGSSIDMSPLLDSIVIREACGPQA
jgi:hypothetical protein